MGFCSIIEESLVEQEGLLLYFPAPSRWRSYPFYSKQKNEWSAVQGHLKSTVGTHGHIGRTTCLLFLK